MNYDPNHLPDMAFEQAIKIVANPKGYPASLLVEAYAVLAYYRKYG